MVTASLISRGACIVREKPFLRWTKHQLVDDAALAVFLREPAEHLARAEGLFPRHASEMPMHLGVFADLKTRIRAAAPAAASDEEVRQWTLGLARCKLCAFAAGLCHFIPFIDHACIPNCEVQALDGTMANDTVEIFALRDICPGEALNISYINELDYPRQVRGVLLQENDRHLSFRSQ
jgi:hypothetical protein